MSEPEGLAKLRELCRGATEEDPELTLIIEDPDASFEPEEIFDSSVFVDVFGKLLREQEEEEEEEEEEAAIDWNEVKERERWSAFPEDDESPPVALREKERTQDPAGDRAAEAS